jgi:hypothetical protein
MFGRFPFSPLNFNFVSQKPRGGATNQEICLDVYLYLSRLRLFSPIF